MGCLQGDHLASAVITDSQNESFKPRPFALERQFVRLLDPQIANILQGV